MKNVADWLNTYNEPKDLSVRVFNLSANNSLLADIKTH